MVDHEKKVKEKNPAQLFSGVQCTTKSCLKDFTEKHPRQKPSKKFRSKNVASTICTFI